MFRNCQDEESIKKLYRRLANFLHPDKGGEADLMIMLTKSFERSLVDFKKSEKKYVKPDAKYENTYDDIPYEKEDKRFDLIKDILKYAKNNPKYKKDYIESIMEFINNNGFITSAQYNSLVKTYYAFRMDREDKKG
jgi:curved DNA-binding protein CbpA